MICIGIDPGLKGAIAITDGRAIFVRLLRDCYDDDMQRIDPERFRAALDSLRAELGTEDAIAIERQQAMKREGRTQGVSSTFKTAVNYGVLLGACSALPVPLFDAHPKVWRRHAGITVGKGDPKIATIRKIRAVFPTLDLQPARFRTDHDGIADAAGIALAGLTMMRATTNRGSNV